MWRILFDTWYQGSGVEKRWRTGHLYYLYNLYTKKTSIKQARLTFTGPSEIRELRAGPAKGTASCQRGGLVVPCSIVRIRCYEASFYAGVDHSPTNKWEDCLFFGSRDITIQRSEKRTKATITDPKKKKAGFPFCVYMRFRSGMYITSGPGSYLPVITRYQDFQLPTGNYLNIRGWTRTIPGVSYRRDLYLTFKK